MKTDKLPDRLREIRQKKGFTQMEIASKLNMTRQSLSNYECGIRFPSPELLADFADLYDVSTDWLLTGMDHCDR